MCVCVCVCVCVCAGSAELKQLRQACSDTLDEYYASQSHQKRALYGGLGELRREAAAVLGTKTSINIAAVEDHGGRTFLSEETAINLLQVPAATHRGRVRSGPGKILTLPVPATPRDIAKGLFTPSANVLKSFAERPSCRKLKHGVCYFNWIYHAYLKRLSMFSKLSFQLFSR